MCLAFAVASIMAITSAWPRMGRGGESKLDSGRKETNGMEPADPAVVALCGWGAPLDAHVCEAADHRSNGLGRRFNAGAALAQLGRRGATLRKARLTSGGGGGGRVTTLQSMGEIWM